jgi:hypothetical protein
MLLHGRGRDVGLGNHLRLDISGIFVVRLGQGAGLTEGEAVATFIIHDSGPPRQAIASDKIRAVKARLPEPGRSEFRPDKRPWRGGSKTGVRERQRSNNDSPGVLKGTLEAIRALCFKSVTVVGETFTAITVVKSCRGPKGNSI